MRQGSGSVKTIHDAIDALVGRREEQIRARIRKQMVEDEEKAYKDTGVRDLMDKLEALVGDTVGVRPSPSSKLGKALRLPSESLRYGRHTEPEEILALRLVAEDAHIKVVAGDKVEVLNDLRKALGL